MTPFWRACRAIVIVGWIGLFAGVFLAPSPFMQLCGAVIAALVVVHIVESLQVARLARTRGVPPGPEVLQTMVFGYFHLEPFRRAASS